MKIILDSNKKRELEACVRRMLDAARDGITATATIGIALKEIHDEELFLARHSTWKAYVEELHNENEDWTYRRVFELMSLGERIPDILSKCRDMGLPWPINECQLRPLLSLTPPKAVEVWIKVANKAKERNVQITGQFVAAEAALHAEIHTPGSDDSFVQSIDQLSAAESDRLKYCERIIREGLQTFIQVGEALQEIRDSRLYRDSDNPERTFEDYCLERWGFTHRHANRLIEASDIMYNLGPMGPLPTSEGQVRPLAKLDPDQQRQAWNIATADNQDPTSREVQEAVEEVLEW